MFLVLGTASGLSVFFQTVMYGISGEYMTKRLRSLTFRAMLKQVNYYKYKCKNSYVKF